MKVVCNKRQQECMGSKHSNTGNSKLCYYPMRAKKAKFVKGLKTLENYKKPISIQSSK
jgi:hypothetical protein